MSTRVAVDDAAAAQADVASYRRLATIDPPALHALIAHLEQSSRESDQLATEHPGS
jgi:hypothetical protein